jgi:hypothetical protein
MKKTIPKSNRATFYDDAKKREKWPGPGQYFESAKKMDFKAIDPEWKVSQGAFKKCPRNTEIDMIIKGAKKQEMPGPGAYKPIPKFKASDIKKDPAHANKEVPLGKIE